MKRYLWHCTTDYHGIEWFAERRSPRNLSSGEPPTPRLCVAPTIAQCFAAVLFAQGKPVYCYRTDKPRRGIAPRNVWDSVITGERWLIPPIRLTLQKVISAEEAEAAQQFVWLFHNCTKRNSSVRIRVAQLACASRVLGGPSTKARAQKCLKICGIEDPEAYLFNLTEEAV